MKEKFLRLLKRGCGSGDIEILLDYETRKIVTLKELIPDWWGYGGFV